MCISCNQVVLQINFIMTILGGRNNDNAAEHFASRIFCIYILLMPVIYTYISMNFKISFMAQRISG